jgi:hypothetical protein
MATLGFGIMMIVMPYGVFGGGFQDLLRRLRRLASGCRGC